MYRFGSGDSYYPASLPQMRPFARQRGHARHQGRTPAHRQTNALARCFVLAAQQAKPPPCIAARVSPSKSSCWVPNSSDDEKDHIITSQSFNVHEESRPFDKHREGLARRYHRPSTPWMHVASHSGDDEKVIIITSRSFNVDLVRSYYNSSQKEEAYAVAEV